MDAFSEKVAALLVEGIELHACDYWAGYEPKFRYRVWLGRLRDDPAITQQGHARGETPYKALILAEKCLREAIEQFVPWTPPDWMTATPAQAPGPRGKSSLRPFTQADLDSLLRDLT